jgi:pimeloyl-ACP methyl ester carboxylesterase
MADVVANGVRHHVQRLGTGAPVVFVHGLVMDNLSSFYFTLANPVAARAEAVLYDLRGHGMSERPTTGYRIADFVADLAALIARLELRPPVQLVGNSFGGTLALAVAAAHPELVRAITLIDAHDGTAGFAQQMTRTLSLEGEARDAKIAENFQSWLGRHSERKRNRLARAAEALVHGTSLVADLAASPPLDLRAVCCPVHALYGERSDVRACGERLARALPACTLELVPDCTHSVLWEATARVRERVVELVA